VLRRAVAEDPERIALVDGGAPSRRWTYAQLLADDERVAHALLARFEPGERVAMWAPNRPEWELFQLGAALAGIVLVTMNPAYRTNELRYVLAQSDAAGLLYQEEYRGHDMSATVAAVRVDLPRLREVVGLRDWDRFTACDAPARPLPNVALDQPAQIQYTSGTTGFPKGAMLQHYAIVNVARFVAQRAGLTRDGAWINFMPMFHVGGCVLGALGSIAHRATHVLVPAFDARTVLRLIEQERGSVMLAVPTMLVALFDEPDVATRDLSSLRAVISGGSPVPPALARRVQSDMGASISITYGQTEMNGAITQTFLDDSPEDQAETVGRAQPHVAIKVVNPATGEIVPLGRAGEVCTRGYQNMIGYHDMPAATVVVLDPDGWLHSGDLGTLDARGYLRITGRLKDMIIRGGENIYPREIEEVLFGHPGVAEAAIIGVPDEKWGEQVAAVIRPQPGGPQPQPDLLDQHCRAHLAAYKTPRLWFYVDEFPMTPSGKIQKFVLTERILSRDLAPAQWVDDQSR
jgi:fatty-acyl-CoA synthase